jgi:hypothetical protein
MLEMYVMYQLARQPLQAFTRHLVCRGYTLATGRQCPNQIKTDAD